MDRAHAESVERVALAALLHDVGKFVQRAEVDPERCRQFSNLAEFARIDSATGRISYHHAAYTWQFIEDHLAWLTRVGGPEGNVAQWAARHHNPSSVWDWIVAESDRLSAGMDRGHEDEGPVGWRAVQTRRLTPLAARISLDGAERNDAAGYELGLSPLELAGSIFPQRATQREQEAGLEDYRRLFVEFISSVERIPQGDAGTFFRTFLSVYEQFAWCIPAATNTQPMDVSLFEHSRAAAAIAAALAYELHGRGTLTVDAARDREAARYALTVGDLGGIQRFLYTIVTKRAARALRGRSLALQLIADGIAEKFLRELSLPPVNVLYNGAGKLWMLLPRCTAEAALRLAEEIDLAMQDHSGGRLSFALGFSELRGKDFVSKSVADRWQSAARDMEAKRRRRLSSLISNSYERIFAPRGDPAMETRCRACGKDTRDLEEQDEEAVCKDCRDLMKLGGLAPRATCLIRLAGSDWHQRLERCRSRLADEAGDRGWAYELPEELGAVYLLTTQEEETCMSVAGRSDVVFTVNQPPKVLAGEAAAGMWLAGFSRAGEEAGPAPDFDELCKRAEGVERLGVLRMDVDSLGEIFRTGLRGEEATFSRITNLSKSLAYFFGGYLPHLLAEAQIPDARSVHAQIIYSGGDDLLAVGAWSVMPHLAREIRRRFGEFTCHNPRWGISGGIAIVRAEYPVAAAVEQAGELESKAKARSGPDGEKDSIAFLDDVMSWRELAVADKLCAELRDLVEPDDEGGESLSRSFLHRLAKIALEYRESMQTMGSRAPRPIAEVEDAARHGRWAWMAAYALARATSKPDLRNRLEELAAALPGKQFEGIESARDLIWLLRPATAWADLLTRRREN